MTGAKTELNVIEKQIYRRHIILDEIGEAGQLRLLQSSVLIVGLGGLGSPAALYLAACGVGRLGIVDRDRVELSNLQRQILHGIEDVGRGKTLSAGETLRRIRKEVHLDIHSVWLDEKNAGDIISPYDFVIEATDNFESKFLVNDTCVSLGKAFSHAGIAGTYGQTMTVVPGEGPCFRCVFEDTPDPESIPPSEEPGVLGTVPGVLGAIQATEAIKYLLRKGDLLVGRLLTWDAFPMRFREVPLPPARHCKVCRQKQ